MLKKSILFCIALLALSLCLLSCKGTESPQTPHETDETFTNGDETTGEIESESGGQESEDQDPCQDGHNYVDFVCSVCGMKKPSEGLVYQFDEEQQGYIVVEIGTCSDLEIVIPCIYEGYPVIGIGETAFRGCQEMTSITIPDSVKSIGDSAFLFCQSLSQIEFLGGGIQFQGRVFGSVPSLNRVLIPSIEAWCNNYFGGTNSTPMTNGADLYIRDKLVTELTIPDSIMSIPDYAFYNCGSITDVSIPAEVISIGEYSFGGELDTGNNLQSVTIAPNSRLTKIGRGAFQNCAKLMSFSILVGVTEIGDSAFFGCDLLKSIEIPKTVEKIGQTAFAGSGLEKIYITDLASWCKINFRAKSNVLSNGVKLYLNGECVTDLMIPNDVKAINPYAFSDYDALTSVFVPESVETIGNSAFRGCDQLECVIFEGEENIEFGLSVFSECTSLTDVSLPNGVEVISEQMFSNCSSLKTVSLPSGLTKIDRGAFQRCAELMHMEIPDTVHEIGTNAFSYCSHLSTVTFTANSNLIDIGMSAFSGCELLNNFIIPSRVKTIGAGAFLGCSNLTSMEIPASTEELVGGFWFEGCDMLTTITVASGNPNYHASGNCLIDTSNKTLIMGCKNSKIPSDGSVTKIGAGAFGSFLDLTSIVIPKTIIEIENEVFRDCRNFETLYYGGTESEWENVNINFNSFGYANEILEAATVYFYSQNSPTASGNYWHYVDGVPTPW